MILHSELYRTRIPVILAFEGWDAAGKGGNIRRLAYPLDPRGFDVIPIASPTPGELARHYLWRFWTRLPRSGHVTIFDRSWYGRVMVERIEGYCGEDDWKRAYGEINEFEKELVDYGTIVLKFWIHIDPETQLERFEQRQNTPEKQWKITDDDWRQMMAVDLSAPFYLTRALLPEMIRRKQGRIINISSMWGVCGASCEVHYSAAKAGLIGMTRALAAEVAPSGITVNAVAPGVIDTDLYRMLGPETMTLVLDDIPVGRIGPPADVVRAVLFLADDGAGFITGQVLGVNGGMVI